MQKPNLQPLRPALLRLLTVAGWTVAWLGAGFLVALLVMAQRGPLSVFLYISCTGLGLFVCAILYDARTFFKAWILGG